jgi:flagellar biogenesis protein FliO
MNIIGVGGVAFGFLYLTLVMALVIFLINMILRLVRASERKAEAQTRCAAALERIARSYLDLPK